MATQLTNHYLYQVMTGNIDWANDTFNCLLMDTSFSFDRDTHATLADVVANEITSAGGYARDELTVDGVIENDTDNTCDVSVSDLAWTPSGADYDSTVGVIIFDDTSADDTVVGFIDFGVTETPEDLITFPVTGIDIRLGG